MVNEGLLRRREAKHSTKTDVARQIECLLGSRIGYGVANCFSISANSRRSCSFCVVLTETISS